MIAEKAARPQRRSFDFTVGKEGRSKIMAAVRSTMSFSRDAKDLDYSQSTVTHQIKGLERELGVRLFDRFRFAHKIALTDAGRHAYLYATRLLALAEEAKVAVQPNEKTTAAKKPTLSKVF